MTSSGQRRRGEKRSPRFLGNEGRGWRREEASSAVTSRRWSPRGRGARGSEGNDSIERCPCPRFLWPHRTEHLVDEETISKYLLNRSELHGRSRRAPALLSHLVPPFPAPTEVLTSSPNARPLRGTSPLRTSGPALLRRPSWRAGRLVRTRGGGATASGPAQPHALPLPPGGGAAAPAGSVDRCLPGRPCSRGWPVVVPWS